MKKIADRIRKCRERRVMGVALQNFDMDYAMKRLAEARERLIDSFDRFMRQRELVAHRERNGHDTTDARESLARLEANLAVHSDTCERLVAEYTLASRPEDEPLN
jgi:hypothetical protein